MPPLSLWFNWRASRRVVATSFAKRTLTPETLMKRLESEMISRNRTGSSRYRFRGAMVRSMTFESSIVKSGGEGQRTRSNLPQYEFGPERLIGSANLSTEVHRAGVQRNDLHRAVAMNEEANAQLIIDRPTIERCLVDEHVSVSDEVPELGLRIDAGTVISRPGHLVADTVEPSLVVFANAAKNLDAVFYNEIES